MRPKSRSGRSDGAHPCRCSIVPSRPLHGAECGRIQRFTCCFLLRRLGRHAPKGGRVAHPGCHAAPRPGCNARPARRWHGTGRRSIESSSTLCVMPCSRHSQLISEEDRSSVGIYPTFAVPRPSSSTRLPRAPGPERVVPGWVWDALPSVRLPLERPNGPNDFETLDPRKGFASIPTSVSTTEHRCFPPTRFHLFWGPIACHDEEYKTKDDEWICTKDWLVSSVQTKGSSFEGYKGFVSPMPTSSKKHVAKWMQSIVE